MREMNVYSRKEGGGGSTLHWGAYNDYNPVFGISDPASPNKMAEDNWQIQCKPFIFSTEPDQNYELTNASIFR